MPQQCIEIDSLGPGLDQRPVRSAAQTSLAAGYLDVAVTLTPQERRVARPVAEDASNKAVAASSS
jgi:FixJ family two-component response regulator